MIRLVDKIQGAHFLGLASDRFAAEGGRDKDGKRGRRLSD